MTKTILLVEDDTVTAKALSAVLEKNGYVVLNAGSGTDAIALALSDERINLILMDIDLGEGTDGAEAAKQIIARKSIPLIFLTAHNEYEYVERVKGINRYGYVLKNSGNHVLLSSIEMAFELFTEHEKMQNSEEKYRLVFDYSPLGLIHFDEKGIINTCNDIFVGIIGSSREALTGLNMLKLPDDKIREAVEDTLEGNLGHYEGIYHSVTAEKQTPVRIVFAPLRSSDGKVIGGVGVIEDVTEQKMAFDLLKKSNEDLEAANEEFEAINEELVESNQELNRREEEISLIIDNSPISMEIVDKDGYVIRLNAAHTRLFGAVPPDDYSVFSDPFLKELGMLDLVERVRSGEVVYFPEFYYNTRDLDESLPDNPLWIRIIGYPLPGINGTHERYVFMQEDVSESRRTTAELISEKNRSEEREKNYREIFDSSNDAIFIHDSITGAMLDVNKTMLEMYGFENKDEVLGGSLECLTDRGDALSQEKVIDIMCKALESENKTFEWNVKRKDGSLFWLEVTFKRVKINDEIRIMATGRDITRRKQTENALDESKLLLHLLIESLPQSVYAKDVDGRFVFANQNYCKTHGKSLDDIVGKTDFDLHPSALAEKYRMDDRHVLETGRLIELEEEHQPLDGKKTVVQVIKTPFYDFEGKIGGTLGIFWDITERKLADYTLAQEKERLSITLRSIGDGVITTDINGKVEILNRVAEELTGWKQEEAKNLPVGEVFNIINEITRKPQTKHILDALVTGIFDESLSNIILISKDGTERLIMESGSAIKDRNENITGVILVFRDITEKRKYEETVQNAQKLESLGILAGGIAHDFNNLLGGIFGNVDLAKLKNKDSRIEVYLKGALGALGRARGLTQQLLTFSRGGTPFMKPERLSPFIQDTVQFALSGSNVSCSFDIPDDLPPCFFDRNQIGQVLDNLVINAQQSMPAGGIVEVSAAVLSIKGGEHAVLRQGNYVKISIKDSGTGISKEIIHLIFDPFFSTKSRGHGLGLATCYSIINRHGGAIDVESIPGEGSIFHVYLPVSDESAQVSEEKKIIRHKGSGFFLVMDDEDIMLNILSGMLTEFGYKVIAIKDGMDAVNYFVKEKKLNHDFSGMIFDLTVPGGVGGIDAIIKIRKIDGDIPVFVSSGYSEDPAMANPQDFGFTASIRKPFQISELSEMLEKYIVNKKI